MAYKGTEKLVWLFSVYLVIIYIKKPRKMSIEVEMTKCEQKDGTSAFRFKFERQKVAVLTKGGAYYYVNIFRQPVEN